MGKCTFLYFFGFCQVDVSYDPREDIILGIRIQELVKLTKESTMNEHTSLKINILQTIRKI